MFLQEVASSAERAKALACRRGLAVIVAQVGQRLFTFENRGNRLFAEARSIGGDISPIPALRQSDFRGARRVSVRLRPQER
jgi:hypothetical protein